MSRVWSNAPAEGSDLLVLLALADFCNDEGVCWPSMRTIAAKSRLQIRATQQAIRRLEESGCVAVEQRAGPNMVNLYHVATEGWNAKLQGCSPVRGAQDAPVQPTAPGGGAFDAGGVVHGGAPKPSLREPSRRGEGSARAARATTTASGDPMDPEFVDRMVKRFGAALGGRAGVLERIEEAVNHPSVLKWKVRRLGVQNWLRRDAERSRAFAPRDRPARPAEPSEAVAAAVETEKAIDYGLATGQIQEGAAITRQQVVDLSERLKANGRRGEPRSVGSIVGPKEQRHGE